uniref:ADP ribosylation factor like GTPase 10 n=1 Tax=Calidris pygmaea TaxID=425635 RepID=A0A8C3KER3_9CHAR
MAPAGALRELTLALGAAVAVLGSLLFIAVKIYFRGTDTDTGTGWNGWWERELRELRDRAPPGDALDWRQVLVLGLDGAGKSSVLHYLCSQTARDRIAPTRGFNSAQLFIQGMEMDLLEGKAGLGSNVSPPPPRAEGPPACRHRLGAPSDGKSGSLGVLWGGASPDCPPLRCLILPVSCSGRQPEPASLLAPLPGPGPRAGVRGGLGGQVTPADSTSGAARAAGQ